MRVPMWSVTLILSLALSAGCGARRGPAPSGSAAAASHSSARELEGVWIVSLTEEELRRLAIRRYAIADEPPSEADMREQGLGDEELDQIARLRALPRDAPQLQGVRDEVARLDGSRLVITRDTMTMQVGAREHEVEWAVTERQGDLLTLRMEARDGSVTAGQIRLGPDDTLVLIDSSGAELMFERR